MHAVVAVVVVLSAFAPPTPAPTVVAGAIATGVKSTGKDVYHFWSDETVEVTDHIGQARDAFDRTRF